MSDLKTKQVFRQDLNTNDGDSPELTAKHQFDEKQKFVPQVSNSDESELASEQKLEQVIRPSKGGGKLAGGLAIAFAGLVGWQSIDSVVTAISAGDWLTLGWTGFIATLAGLGIGALGKELWQLRRLRQHFATQQELELLLSEDSVGQAKDICSKIAKDAGIPDENPDFERWVNALQSSHSDAEVIEMYDAMVVQGQDKKASAIVAKCASESAVLVAVSPLAVADMLLVAWRSFKMVNDLSDLYGIKLGYWSRIKLFKLVLMNMALAGGSELAIDVSMDAMSMDLASKVSVRAGQGIGVGLLTARLGIKAMALLRPLPWHSDRKVKLESIRKQIIQRVR